jgi:hypothetical protein
LLKALGFITRIYSYFFHLLLSLFLIGVAAIAYSSHQPLTLSMLPFSQEQLVLGTFLLGLIGIVCVLLALARIFKYAFPIWAAYVVYAMVKGYLFSSYSFGSMSAFTTALWMLLAAVIALIGALWTLKPRRGRLYI